MSCRDKKGNGVQGFKKLVKRQANGKKGFSSKVMKTSFGVGSKTGGGRQNKNTKTTLRLPKSISGNKNTTTGGGDWLNSVNSRFLAKVLKVNTEGKGGVGARIKRDGRISCFDREEGGSSRLKSAGMEVGRILRKTTAKGVKLVLQEGRGLPRVASIGSDRIRPCRRRRKKEEKKSRRKKSIDVKGLKRGQAKRRE